MKCFVVIFSVKTTLYTIKFCLSIKADSACSSVTMLMHVVCGSTTCWNYDGTRDDKATH